MHAHLKPCFQFWKRAAPKMMQLPVITVAAQAKPIVAAGKFLPDWGCVSSQERKGGRGAM